MFLITAGCAGAPKRTALPPELVNQAGIPGVPNARLWGDDWPEFSVKIFNTYSKEELQKKFPGVFGIPHTYLAISGGGAEGAFGAGLLLGWTASGTRPEFTMVTGTSTGALTAPFAFLGAEYDPILKEVYTTTVTTDILLKKKYLSLIFGDSATDSAPLLSLIEKYISDDIIEAIAGEYLRGRKMLIGTYNLDAGRPVIWDIGAIAASNSSEKQNIIWDILLASASIPVVFPPVLIEVNVDGKTYDEMHVDGGTGDQVFVYPASFGWRRIIEKLDVPGQPSVFVIRNSFLHSNYQTVDPKIIPIATRSISSLIKNQGMGDLFEIYLLCHRDGTDFNLAHRYTHRRSYGSDVDHVIKILKECGDGHPLVMSQPPPKPLFLKLGESSLNFELRVWLHNYIDRFDVLSELNREIESEFALNGVEIPFLQRDLHLKSSDITVSDADRAGPNNLNSAISG